MMENPLHPFELHNFIHLSLFGLDISINKAVVLMWIVIAVVAGLLLTAARSRQLVPTRLQNVVEIYVEFIRGVIADTMGPTGMRFFPLIATLFIFILFSNLLGLIPGSYTITSQIVVTAAFALFIYAISIILGFVLHGRKFLGILIPPGTPGWLLPLMMPIELVSQLARPVSLAVRLFANMTAGHVILGVLFGMVITIPSVPLPVPIKVVMFICLLYVLLRRQRLSNAFFYGSVTTLIILLWTGSVPFGGTLFVYGLEAALIAPIQAYIFTVLSCVYLGDAINLHGHEAHPH